MRLSRQENPGYVNRGLVWNSNGKEIFYVATGQEAYVGGRKRYIRHLSLIWATPEITMCLRKMASDSLCSLNLVET